MHRITGLPLALALLSALAAAAQTGPSPTIHFSIYAPEQKDSPVRIVGFGHDRSEIHFVLANTSDKSVAAVIIERMGIVPLGCGARLEPEPYWPVRYHYEATFKVGITPWGRSIVGTPIVGRHGESVRLRFPELTVEQARSTGAAYTQVQFGVTGVSFNDGTAWPAGIAFMFRDGFRFANASPPEMEKVRTTVHSDPFDPSLAEADKGRCNDVSSVVNALQSVNHILFDPESPDIANQDDIAPALPHVHFSCRLESPNAVCQLPLETQPKTGPQTR
jgi:hypothetical protein